MVPRCPIFLGIFDGIFPTSTMVSFLGDVWCERGMGWMGLLMMKLFYDHRDIKIGIIRIYTVYVLLYYMYI